jgi:hypothetical protein
MVHSKSVTDILANWIIISLTKHPILKFKIPTIQHCLTMYFFNYINQKCSPAWLHNCLFSFTGRFLPLLTGSRFCASRRLRDAYEFCRQRSEWSSYNSQITGGVEYAVPVSCGSISPSITDCRNELPKWTLLAGWSGWKAWITVVLYGLWSSVFVALLSLDFDTQVSWPRRFSDFLDVCSTLAPMSSNFSVRTQHLCFCFLSIKTPVALSLFPKVWTVCLLGTLSSQNLRRNFRWHFLAGQYVA